MLKSYFNLQMLILIFIPAWTCYLRYKNKYVGKTTNKGSPIFSTLVLIVLYMTTINPKETLLVLFGLLDHPRFYIDKTNLIFSKPWYLKYFKSPMNLNPLKTFGISVYVITPIILIFVCITLPVLAHGIIYLKKSEIKTGLIRYAAFFTVVIILKYKLFIISFAIYGFSAIALFAGLFLYSRFAKCPLL